MPTLLDKSQRPGKTGLMAVVFLAGFQLLLFLGSEDVTSPFEGRVAAPARGMAASGDWLVPRLNGEPRLEKPPLPYWCAAALWKATGTFDVLWLRLGPALCGVAAAVLVMDLGRRWLGAGCGLAAGLVWSTTYFVVAEHRKAMADPYLAFFALLAVWGWVAADQTLSGRGHGARSRLLILLFWAAAALGGLAKGPVVFLHLLTAIASYHWAIRRRPAWAWTHAGGLLLFLLVALPWPVLVSQAMPGAIAFWSRESAAHVVAGGDPRPWWFYGPQVPWMALPWTLFLIPAATGIWRASRAGDRRSAWALLWLGLGVLLFSCFGSKKDAYLLPLMPALAMAVAVPFAGGLEAAPRGHRASFGLFLRAHIVAGTAAAAALTAYTVFRAVEEGYGPLSVGALLAVAGGSILGACLQAFSGDAGENRKQVVAIVVLFACSAHVKVAWLDPLRQDHESPAPFAARVVAIAGSDPIHAVGGLGEALLFYLGRRIELVARAEQVRGGLVLMKRRDVPLVREGKVEILTLGPRKRDEGDQLCLIRVSRG